MTPSKQLLEKLLRDCPNGQSPAAYLSDQLARVERIAFNVKGIRARQRALKDEMEKKFQALEHELYELRKTCLHEDQTFHPDPAGGRDSHYSCNICGKNE